MMLKISKVSVVFFVFSVNWCLSSAQNADTPQQEPAKQEPKIREQFAIEGSSYKMKCIGPGPGSGLGDNLASSHYIVWAINGKPPLRGPKYKILPDGLVIRNVSREDTLVNYTCSALDRLAFIPVYSENIRLKLRQREGRVLIEPRRYVSTLIGEKVKVWGVLNQQKTLHCRMYSRPSPTFEWMDHATGNKILNGTGPFSILNDETSSNLTVSIRNDTFFKEYACKASNALGESTQVFILAQGYRPKFPFIFPTFIGKDRMTLRVEPQEENKDRKGSERLPVESYIIQFATAESLRSTTITTTGEVGNVSGRKKWTTISRTVDETKGKNGAETFELQGLQENTTYFVRAAVTNSAASSSFSPAIRITTDASAMQSIRRPVYIKNTAQKSGGGREGHGRSSLITSANAPRGPNPDAEEFTIEKKVEAELEVKEECMSPKFRKTIITTMTVTTLYENLINEEETSGAKGKLTIRGIGSSGNASSNAALLKKKVEEETKIDRMKVCDLE